MKKQTIFYIFKIFFHQNVIAHINVLCKLTNPYTQRYRVFFIDRVCKDDDMAQGKLTQQMKQADHFHDN